MDLKILHFYPDLMSLYGSYANVSILKRTLEEMGNTVTVERVELGGDADLTHADFVYMGAGTERAQKAALLYFSKLGDAVKAAADAGVTMLIAGNSMELQDHHRGRRKGGRRTGTGGLHCRPEQKAVRGGRLRPHGPL